VRVGQECSGTHQFDEGGYLCAGPGAEREPVDLVNGNFARKDRPRVTDEIAEVIITGPSPDWLAEFSRELIERRLAACAQHFHPIRSLYHWQGKIEDEPEARVALHTRRALVPEIIAQTNDRHPYDVPCVMPFPFLTPTRPTPSGLSARPGCPAPKQGDLRTGTWPAAPRASDGPRRPHGPSSRVTGAIRSRLIDQMPCLGASVATVSRHTRRHDSDGGYRGR
jgi:periplasmic divalent cation tolerance protein